MPSEAPAAPQFDEAIVQQVMELGFPRVRAEKAAVATHGQDVQAAMEWIFAHASDPDIDVPLSTPKGA